MGQEAMYRCNKCGSEFTAHGGGGFTFIEYRCFDCDTIKVVTRNRSKEDIGKCEKCHGELKEDLEPMCQKCKSRNVKKVKKLMVYD